MKLRHLLLGSVLALGSATAAEAAITTPTGWYLSLGAGANWVEDGRIDEFTSGVLTTTNQFSWDTGYIVAGAIGYDFGNNWRGEFEVAYRHNDVDRFCASFSQPTCGSTIGGANMWELSQMINVLYDFPVGGNWELSVGAGVGGNLVVFNPGPSGNFDSSNLGVDADDYVLAGQLIAQVAYRIAERWQLYLDYHFMFMDDPDLQDPTQVSETWEIEKTEHSLLLGVRFDLQREGAPPPPAASPVAPPESPKEFIVFFGFNKANLTGEAARVVADAAEAAQESGAPILIVGHTDTSGSQAYNLRLSLRRADAVKGGLIQNGVPAEMITVSGKGEDEPMVQTGDGVKEPQNRRAVIILRIQMD